MAVTGSFLVGRSLWSSFLFLQDHTSFSEVDLFRTSRAHFITRECVITRKSPKIAHGCLSISILYKPSLEKTSCLGLLKISFPSLPVSPWLFPAGCTKDVESYAQVTLFQLFYPADARSCFFFFFFFFFFFLTHSAMPFVQIN